MKKKFKKVVNYKTNKNFFCAFMVMTIVAFLANVLYFALINNKQYNDTFFPIGFLLITLIISFIIALFFTVERDVVYEEF